MDSMMAHFPLQGSILDGHFVTRTNSEDLIEDVVGPILPSGTSNLEGG